MRTPKLMGGVGIAETRKGSTLCYRGFDMASMLMRVRNPQCVPKREGYWFIPSSYRGPDGRSHAAQRKHGEFFAVCGDVDVGNLESEALWKPLKTVTEGGRWFLYSTKSTTQEDKRWRFVVPLARPIMGSHYKACATALYDALAGFGIQCDYSAARAAQISYLPNKGQHYEWASLESAQHYFDLKGSPLWDIACNAVAEKKAVPSYRPQEPRSHVSGKGDYSTLDIVGWFKSHGHYIEHLERNVHAVRCPFDHEINTTGDCVVFEADGSWPGFDCKHSTCQGRNIRDVLALWGDADAFCSQEWRAER